MITFIKGREEIPNYETLNYNEPNTDKILSHCKVLNRDKKQIIDTTQISKQYKWQGSIPQSIRDINLNIKNDPKNIFKSRKNSCNNSMLSTQRVDVSPVQDKTFYTNQSGEFSHINRTRKSSSHNYGNTTTNSILTEIKNSPQSKLNERFVLKHTGVQNQNVRGFSMQSKRTVYTENEDPHQKSIAVKYIGVHNDVIGILSRKVPLQIEQDKVQLFLNNKDQRKCKSRQSTRQSTCPAENMTYDKNIHQDYHGNHLFYTNQQSDQKQPFNSYETGKQKMSLCEYEDIVSQMTNQFKINKKYEQQSESFSEQQQQQPYLSLQNSTQKNKIPSSNKIESNNNIFNQNNMSSNDSTPLQNNTAKNYKKVFFNNESILSSTDYGVSMNQNYMNFNNQNEQFQRRDAKPIITPKYNSSHKNDNKQQQYESLSLTPQKQINISHQEKQLNNNQGNNHIQDNYSNYNNNQQQIIIQHKQFIPKRSMSSQARRLDSHEKEDLLKQIENIQNKKFNEYIQENQNVNKLFYQSFQSQKNYLKSALSPSSQNSSPKSFHQDQQENNEYIQEQPNPKKYDSYIINKYAISKRLKPIVKNKPKNQKLGNISNVQVEWVNSEKKVTYY